MVDQPKEARGITAIAVSGFKSLRDESRIEIRNLTVLAGANSSGKSSIMQPLLLLKQTLEAPYDPGPLKLDGPNVTFAGSNQLLWVDSQKFHVEIDVESSQSITNIYQLTRQNSPVELQETIFRDSIGDFAIRRDMSQEEILNFAKKRINPDFETYIGITDGSVVRERCFLVVRVRSAVPLNNMNPVPQHVSSEIAEIIHIPGLRSGSYPSIAKTDHSANRFAGVFTNYVGRLIADWQEDDADELHWLFGYLNLLKLTSYVRAVGSTDLSVEIHVGRTLKSGKEDTVNINQVGFGVSQVLPVLVALLVAEPGQLVYIEQPELHLHPRAQVKLAEIIAEASNRGVRVVIETHSDLLILGIQTLVAEGKLTTDKAIFHWFTRDDEGVTHINSTELEKDGAFKDGSWPEDFAEVRLDAQSRFLDAADLAELTSHNAE